MESLVAGLSPADLRRYLTMLQRAERFTDGTWETALRNGVFDALLSRILALDSEGQLTIGDEDPADETAATRT